jgi:hypothetical protein
MVGLPLAAQAERIFDDADARVTWLNKKTATLARAVLLPGLHAYGSQH